MEEKLSDKEIRNWIIPDFSTTTDTDIAIASMAMMATMKHYIDCRGSTGCGLPSVTLLRVKEDWMQMRRRLDLLEAGTYSKEPATWAKLLASILDRVVTTFENPDSENLKSFWLSIAYARPRMSGQTDTYSG
jgi:hypothetical protein